MLKSQQTFNELILNSVPSFRESNHYTEMDSEELSWCHWVMANFARYVYEIFNTKDNVNIKKSIIDLIEDISSDKMNQEFINTVQVSFFENLYNDKDDVWNVIESSLKFNSRLILKEYLEHMNKLRSYGNL